MINSIGTSSSSLSVTSLLQSESKASNATPKTTISGTAGDSVDLSGPAKLFSALQELATENPDKFKTVTADIAAKLKAAAAEQTDGTSSTSGGTSPLADLETKFEQASKTGDVSVLLPSSDGPPQGAGTYNQQGQIPPPSPSDSGSGTDIKSLFDSITKEVTDALGA